MQQKTAITILLMFISFSAGLALAPQKTIAQTVTTVEKYPVVVSSLSFKTNHYFGIQRDKIAAVIPASALRRVK